MITVDMFDNKFDKAMEFIFLMEGGFSHDVDDGGGVTKYGISSKQYPDIDVRNITKKRAALIYFEDYWLPLKCHIFIDPLATVLFDTGINCGVGSASKWLQLVCNKQGSKLEIDGVIGSVTILEVIKYNSGTLSDGVLSHRLLRYIKLERKPSQRKFFKGWITRTAKLLHYIS